MHEHPVTRAGLRLNAGIIFLLGPAGLNPNTNTVTGVVGSAAGGRR
jgi:hypothetical protein